MHPSYLRSLATPDRKYLCNTPMLLSCASLAPQRGSDKTTSAELEIGSLSYVRLSIHRVPEVVHHFIYILLHRAGLVGVLHGWVDMQTASRHSLASDPAPELSACNTVVPTQPARGGNGGWIDWSERPTKAQSGHSPPLAGPQYSVTAFG